MGSFECDFSRVMRNFSFFLFPLPILTAEIDWKILDQNQPQPLKKKRDRTTNQQTDYPIGPTVQQASRLALTRERGR